MNRAYTNIAVTRYINVSSTGHYFGHVVFRRGGRGWGYDFDLSNGYVMTKKNMDALHLPQYVMTTIRHLYIECLKTDAIYYEYDREGERRYSNLRYHSQETVNWIIECLQKDAA